MKTARKPLKDAYERQCEEHWKRIEKRIAVGDAKVDAEDEERVESWRKWALSKGMEGSLVEYVTDLNRERWYNRHYVTQMVIIGEVAIKKYGMEVVPEQYRLNGGKDGSRGSGDGGGVVGEGDGGVGEGDGGGNDGGNDNAAREQ